MNKPVHITTQNFEAEVLNADLPVLADFWAAWCGPCQMVAPIVEDLAQEYAGRVKVAKVDVDENPDLAARYNIMSIPTLGIFKGGRLVSRIVGFVPKAQLKLRLDADLGANSRATAARG